MTLKTILTKFQNIMKAVYERACEVMLTAAKSLNESEYRTKNGADPIYIYVYRIQEIIKKMGARLHTTPPKIDDILKGPKIKIENPTLHLGKESLDFKSQS